ncbi:ABC transporter permease [Rhodobacteraceae bacterium KMM 6894]|nr:ABC transporter permease [Rhodobacteraceae bacterium KMM 6894]
MSLTRNVAVLGILSVGMAVVVISRGIDLAITVTMSITAAFSVVLMTAGYSEVFALGAGLAAALAIGIFHGWIIAYVEMPALFATLASALFINGFGRWLFMDGQQRAYVPQEGVNYIMIAQERILGVPIPVIMFVVMSLLVAALLKYTNLGRHIYATGDNLGTARLSGISTRVLALITYSLCAVIGFIAGIIQSASTMLVNTQVFTSTLLFDVILVVVIGGVSLQGGRGRIRGVVLGTLLVGIVLNGLTLLNVHSDIQAIIKGLLLLAAILVDNWLHPRNEETARQGDM